MLNQNQLIDKIKSYNSFVDADKIKDAFLFAKQAHITQKRDSGEPYINHPVEVANILAELKLDGPTITTALLHDIIEDTGTTFDEVKKKFGNEIAELVYFLSSDQSKYITGQNIHINGGMLMV